MKVPVASIRSVRAGSALAIILPMIVIVTLIVVSALVLTLFDGRLAANALENQRAEHLSRIALDQVANKLAAIPLDKHWAAAPGRIRHWNGSTWEAINLYSEGSASDQVDLNARLADGSYSILPPNEEYPAAPEMKVSWNYVLDDGQIITDPAALPDKGVVGRFAYWTDIENGRVNINTAGFGMTEFDSPIKNWDIFTNPSIYNNLTSVGASASAKYNQDVLIANPWMTDRVEMDGAALTFPELSRDDAQRKTPQNLVGHPSSIDLSFLDGVTEEESFNTFRYAGSYFLRADARNSNLKTPFSGWAATPIISADPDLSVRFFSTSEDWKLIVDEATFKRNKGYVTTRGRTPEITPWGLPKMALTLLPKDGNVLNELTEGYSTYLQIMTHIDYSLEDSRTVQVPVVMPWWSSAPGRKTLRDMSAVPYWTTNVNATSSVASALLDSLKQTFPGYNQSLASKFDTYSSGEAEQVTQEILSFLDSSLNGYMPAFPLFMGQPGDSGTYPKLDTGQYLPLPASSTTRRSGTSGQFFLSELAMQCGAQYLSEIDVKETHEIKKAIARAGGPSPTPTPPCAVLTSRGPNWRGLFLVRDPSPLPSPPPPSYIPAVDDDRFIKIVLRSEVMIPPRWGLVQPISSHMYWQVRITDLVCEYSSDDPKNAGTHTLRLDDSSPGHAEGTADYNLVQKTKGLLLAGVDNSPLPSRLASENSFHEVVRWGAGGIWIGPFSPGTTVSLRLKARFVLLSHISGGFGTANVARAWSMIPGITSVGAERDEEGFLEFEFPNLQVESLLSGSEVTVSFEVDDPRVARRKGDWKLASEETIGSVNSIYTGSTNGNDSDLSRPNFLLQLVRGRLRAAVIGGWNSAPYWSERQSASKILGLPGVGYLSSVPTGVDSGRPWQTLKFQPSNENPPDWLLWNLLYVPFDRSIANQTDGKLNINATLHPFNIQRRKPLEALFGDRVSNPETIAANIANRDAAAPLDGPSDMYIYNGQLCQISGVANSGADEYEKERLVRDVADIVTTQCDDFRVFIVVQPLRQMPDGRVIPVATQRVEATISRSADVGDKGYAIVDPGNANTALKMFNRGGYETSGISASKQNFATATYHSGYGVDNMPNTADDWLIPQKLQISNYRTIK